MNKTIKAFSLIELLVVLVIISISIAIVAPDYFKLAEKNNRRLEINKVANWFNYVSRKALLSQQNAKIYINKQKLTCEEFFLELNTQYIAFKPTEFEISNKGYANRFLIEYHSIDKEIESGLIKLSSSLEQFEVNAQ